MASRRDVREAFYAELDTAADTLVPSDNIGQEEPNSREELPAIVHNDNYRSVPMHNMSAPTDVDRNNSGAVKALYFSRTMQARFSLTILDEDEQSKEDIYEAVRGYFEDYMHSAEYFPDPSEIQSDVHDVDVTDADSQDFTERDPPMRGDVLQVDLGYERIKQVVRNDLAGNNEYPDPDSTFENIEEVTHNVDADNDGTTDETYTTT